MQYNDSVHKVQPKTGWNMEELLTAEHIRKVYGSRAVLEDISFSIHRGEAVALVGENGCGKSTLLRILSGMTVPTRGKVRVAPHVRAGLIPDRYEKIPLTISRFMSHMLSLERLDASAAQGYYRMFALSDMLNTPMKYLSKGTLQKVAAVQALIGQRDILFVDEPLSGQDALSRLNFIEELRSRKRAGMAVVMACHEPFLIEALADRIYEIKGGRLIDGAAYICRCGTSRCILIAECASAIAETLLHGIPGEPPVAAPVGQFTRIEADVSQSADIFRALLAGGVHIVRYEEEVAL
jgi:ABC-type multidrug transport system ATPase subunit